MARSSTVETSTKVSPAIPWSSRLRIRWFGSNRRRFATQRAAGVSAAQIQALPSDIANSGPQGIGSRAGSE